MTRRSGTWVALVAAAALLGACTTSSPREPTATVPSAPAAPERSAAANFTTGLTVPWAIGGQRIERDGKLGFDLGEWPPFAVQAVRLWDTRTAWLNLEPADGRWDFTTLDAHLAKAGRERVGDVLLVLAGTPRWAAQRVTPDDAPWLGPGSAAPPVDPAQWEEAVRTVATRYRGRLSYEIGNEPNLRTFWNGTPAEFAAFATTAAHVIAEVDPAARVVVDVGLVRRPDDVIALDDWLAPIANDPDVDVISVHVYPSVSQAREPIALLLQARQAVAARTGKPAWVTELNVRDGSSLPPGEQQEVVTGLSQAVEAAGFDRVYWYAWTDLGPDGLIQFAPGTPGAEALSATAGG